MAKWFLFSLLLFSLAGNAQQTTNKTEQFVIQKTVKDFYNWYAGNWKKLNAFKLYRGKKKKDAPPYVIDWKGVEKYFTFIRGHVPQLGETFISNERKFFKECQAAFDKNPGEEIAIGFDYDRFVNGQDDPELVIKEGILATANVWTAIIKGDTATLYITDTGGSENQKSKVELIKEKGVWKIAKTIIPVEG